MSKSPSLHQVILMSKKQRRISKARSTSGRRTKQSAPPTPKMRKAKMLDIPTYAQSEEFTSAAACAMMALKYIDKNFKMKRTTEYDIWREAVNGSVWHGSRYGLAYALAKRNAKPEIISSVRDEGYEKKLAVYEGINLATLKASFDEIKGKVSAMKVKESHGIVTLNTIKRQLNAGKIPIVLVDANLLNPYLESFPYWVVVKGYDKDTMYINDPYSDNTIAIESNGLKAAIGYDKEYHMVSVSAKRQKP